MGKITNVEELKNIAKKVRRGIIEEVYQAQSGHPGGSLSVADILTVLYFNELNINENEPNWEERDRLILSKGHCSPALYSCLANRGFFEEEKLKDFRKISKKLQGHPDMRKIPGVDMTTGSLGQGLSAANGMAIAGKLDKKDYRVYCILGDGEIEEGQIWEACMSSSKYNLNNLILFVDNNGLQIDGTIKDVKNVDNLEEKFNSFGFYVQRINGHNFDEILTSVLNAKKSNKPNVIIANTIKGKGISFMENKAEWHGKKLTDEEYNLSKAELK